MLQDAIAAMALATLLDSVQTRVRALDALIFLIL